jgi:hypothetical protein
MSQWYDVGYDDGNNGRPRRSGASWVFLTKRDVDGESYARGYREGGLERARRQSGPDREHVGQFRSMGSPKKPRRSSRAIPSERLRPSSQAG